MKNIYIYLMLFISISIYSQNKFYYHVVFENESDIPQVLENSNGTINLIFKNREINLVVKKYEIFYFQVFYKYASSKYLKNTFELACNDDNLKFELLDKFPSVFKNIWEYTLIEQQLLYTPDDYNILPSWGLNSSYPSYLDVIGAKDAWDITFGSPNVILGVNEGPIRDTHEDIEGKVVNLVNFSPNTINYPGRRHATAVAGIMAANTNNTKGLSSIGHDCRIAQGSFTQLIDNNSKVINMSWGSPSINTPINSTTQDAINQATVNQGIVFVASAGNGVIGNVTSSFLTTNGLSINAENYAKVRHYPASFKNVISVTTVGDSNIPYTTLEPFDNWIDMHKLKTLSNTKYNGTQTLVSEAQITHQHNDSVDIAVSGYRLPHLNGDSDNIYWSGLFGAGTSYSGPVVSGAIGLMFSVNYCLKPKEIESILKLTAHDIENYPENLEFKGRLGAGRLDAYKAVKMADDMAKPFGTVLVENRNLYRGWFYKLETAPYQIKMINNNVTEASKVKFFARNNIDIISGDYKPETGYVDLQINSNLVLTNCTNPNSTSVNGLIENRINGILPSIYKVDIYPNPTNSFFNLVFDGVEVENFEITIYDIFGKLIYKTTANSNETIIDISSFVKGVYFVKINSSLINKTLKLIKE
jgi:hypothetical protein